MPADYNGDGITDIAVVKPNGQNWWRNGANGVVSVVNFGTAADFNAPGDYDGDGTTDWMKVRTQGSQRIWYLLASTNGFSVRSFGTSSDLVAPADYDGDGRADIAIWRPGTGQWWVLRSSNGGVDVISWGQIGDALPARAYVTAG